MTAAAVGPLAPRGLPGLLWHHGCEQGEPCPALHSCPHSCTWGPKQTPSPVLPSPRPFCQFLCPHSRTVLLPLPHNPEPRSPDPLSPVSAAPIPIASAALALGRRVLLGQGRQQVVE